MFFCVISKKNSLRILTFHSTDKFRYCIEYLVNFFFLLFFNIRMHQNAIFTTVCMQNCDFLMSNLVQVCATCVDHEVTYVFIRLYTSYSETSKFYSCIEGKRWQFKWIISKTHTIYHNKRANVPQTCNHVLYCIVYVYNCSIAAEHTIYLVTKKK